MPRADWHGPSFTSKWVSLVIGTTGPGSQEAWSAPPPIPPEPVSGKAQRAAMVVAGGPLVAGTERLDMSHKGHKNFRRSKRHLTPTDASPMWGAGSRSMRHSHAKERPAALGRTRPGWPIAAGGL